MAPPYAQILPQGSNDEEQNDPLSSSDLDDRHITSAYSRKPRAAAIPYSKWDAVKDTICKVYRSHNGILKKVKAEMESKHGFYAT